jgi:hypothetical protein
MMDFLTFRKMITPIIIQIVFWIAVIGVVLAGCAMVAGALLAPRQDAATNLGPFATLGPLVGGILLIVLGPLAIRIYAELLIVFFKIHDALEEMSKSLAASKNIARPQ